MTGPLWGSVWSCLLQKVLTQGATEVNYGRQFFQAIDLYLLQCNLKWPLSIWITRKGQLELTKGEQSSLVFPISPTSSLHAIIPHCFIPSWTVLWHTSWFCCSWSHFFSDTRYGTLNTGSPSGPATTVLNQPGHFARVLPQYPLTQHITSALPQQQLRHYKECTPHGVPARPGSVLPIHNGFSFACADHPISLAGLFWSSPLFPLHCPEVLRQDSAQPTQAQTFTALKLWLVKPQTHSAFLHCWPQPAPGSFTALSYALSQAGLLTRGCQLGWRPLSRQTFQACIRNTLLATPALAFQEFHKDITYTDLLLRVHETVNSEQCLLQSLLLEAKQTSTLYKIHLN